jgi:hypothetical protein
VARLERRIEDLEGRIMPPRTAAYNPEREAIIAELRQLEAERGPLRQIAEREAEEGDPRRLRALEELEAAHEDIRGGRA